MKAVEVLFVVVGLALFLVFGFSAQTVRSSGGWDPYPGPESPELTLYAGGLHLFSAEEMTGTIPITVIVDGHRFNERGRITNKRYNDGWQIYIDILPPGWDGTVTRTGQ